MVRPGSAAAPPGSGAGSPPSGAAAQSPYGRHDPYARGDIGDDAGMRFLLPVGRSGLAIAAGYLGLFSLLVLPAPLAIVFGILAIVDIRKHPGKHGMGRAIFGIVMGVLAPVLLFGWIIFANSRHW